MTSATTVQLAAETTARKAGDAALDKRLTALEKTVAGLLGTTTPQNVVTVGSIPDLKTAAADNTVDKVIMTAGTYTPDVAQDQNADSLWFGSAFSGRTRPVLIVPSSPGGVIFDAGGADISIGCWFGDGATLLTMDGLLRFRNMVGTPIEFGGFTPTPPAHHITLKTIHLEATCHRASLGSNQEQCIYFANALGRGPHDLLLDGVQLDGTDSLCLWGGIHGFHGDAANPPPDHVTVRNLVTTGLFDPIVMWYDGAGAAQHNWLIDTASITNAREYGCRFESTGASNIQLTSIVSTGSGTAGFFSSMGANPPGVTKTGCSFN